MSKSGNNKTGKGTFQPGHKLSKDKPTYDADEKVVRVMSQGLLSRIYNIYIWKTKSELEAHLKDRNLSVFESTVCRALLNAAKHGSTGTLDYFISRLIGKMPEKLTISNDDPYKDFTIEQMREEHKRLSEINKKTLDHIIDKDEKLNALRIEFRDVTPKPE